MYYLFRSLVKHSCINPKSHTFGYPDEKPIDIGLMKFLGFCPSALSWVSSLYQNEEPMEQHDPTLASIRVHVLDLCLKKAPCLCSMFHLLCRSPLCGLDTSPSSTQVVSPLDLH
ncbi:hypothetical protein BHM03_00035597 [Ensete ventricosum]|nr:hypothetical protein BHM03_00035597 [Ensete ventricosum]